MEVKTESYIKALEEQKDSILSLKADIFEDNHKRTLLFSLMDMIAKTVIPNPRGNKDRFLSFINCFCEWEHSKYISAQQLAYSLQDNSNIDFKELTILANRTLSLWKEGSPVTLNQDIPYEVAEQLWPKNTKLNGKDLKDFTHANLLYMLRNSLVHEMRPLGSPHELFTLVVPHYVQRSELYKDSSNTFAFKHAAWELIHPIQFYVEIIDTAITNAEKYFKTYNVNPIEKFNFSSNWIVI